MHELHIKDGIFLVKLVSKEGAFVGKK